MTVYYGVKDTFIYIEQREFQNLRSTSVFDLFIYKGKNLVLMIFNSRFYFNKKCYFDLHVILLHV